MSLAQSIERIPPQNLEAEQGVLGSMLLDRDAIAKVIELIRPEDFYRDAHRRIFETIADLFERGEPVDLITVTDRLRDKGHVEDVGGAGYVTSLLNAIPTAANVEYYARIVLQKSMLRHLISAGTEIAHMGFEGEHDVELLIDRAEKLVFGIANRRLQQEFLPIRDILKESFERIDRRYQDKGTVTGVPTGFTDLDQLTSGFQPADLVIVAARPAMGKCLRYDAEIVDAQTGEVHTIQEIVSRREARLWTLSAAGTLERTVAAQFVDDGIKPVYRVRTLSGREVETTLSHPFLTPTGWRPLAVVAEGEPIAVPAQLPVFGNADLPSYEVKLLAYLVAGFMPADPLLAADFADAASAGEAIHAATKPSAQPMAMVPVQGGSQAEIVGVIQTRYRALLDPQQVRILPEAVFTLPQPKLALFLSRFLACTSTVESAPALTVRSSVPSRRLARQVQHLLLRFGVAARVDEGGITVTGDAVRMLFQQIGILGYETLRTWARHDQQYLIEPEAIIWDPIATIEYTGDVQVYDLTIPETHNFIANDVCVHNTTFCLNLGAYAAIHSQVPVAIFSLETSKEQLVQRFLCSEAEVDGSKLRTGFLADSDWPKLARAMGRLSEAPIFIDDSATISVIEMRAKARKLKAEYGLGLIVVDYLQMIQSYKRTENRTQEISEIARSLKSLAKELNIPLIAISQLSRAVEATGTRRPMLSHLRECVTADTIVWDADTGRRWTVGELAGGRSRPRLLSLDARGRIVPIRPTAVFQNGVNDVFEVRTSTGRQVRATAKHPLLTPEGWKTVAELMPGALVATVRRLPVFGGGVGSLSLDRMRLLGYLIGDGSYSRHNRVYVEDSRHLAVFCRLVGIGGRKSSLVEQCREEVEARRSKPQVDRLPISVTNELWLRKEAAGLSWRELGFRLQSGKALDRPTATILAEKLGAKGIGEMASSDVLWDKVVSITPAGREPVFDLVMPGTHNFVANGLVVHNSGELEQVADLVVFIYREDYYNPETEKKNIAEIIIAKHRNGPIGQIDMFFHKEHSRFANLERRRA